MVNKDGGHDTRAEARELLLRRGQRARHEMADRQRRLAEAIERVKHERRALQQCDNLKGRRKRRLTELLKLEPHEEQLLTQSDDLDAQIENGGLMVHDGCLIMKLNFPQAGGPLQLIDVSPLRLG